MTPRPEGLKGQSPDYGALYKPPSPIPINPNRFYQTAGFASIAKCMKHSRHMLAAMRSGQHLFEYLDSPKSYPSHLRLPDILRSNILDDEFEEAAADPRRILHPLPANISSAHRRDLLGVASAAELPRKRLAEFVGELRVIGAVLRSLRSIRLGWLLRHEPLPLHYVRLIRREDFDWLEPLLPADKRLHADGASPWSCRRPASCGKPQPQHLQRRGTLAAGGRRATLVDRRSLAPTETPEERDAHARGLLTWQELTAGTEGGERAAGQPPAHPPPWQLVKRAEHRQRHLLHMSRRSDSLDAQRLLSQLQRVCADTRERLFHIYDHRVLRLDAERRQRMAHKYLSVQMGSDADAALQQMRLDVARRVAASKPAVVPARWYVLLEKRAQQLNAGAEVMDELRQLLDPFITNELSTFTSAAERLCLLVMSLPVYELMTPRWQKALMFVLVEVIQHHEGLLHLWLQTRAYHDYILQPI
ncbi:hypothetical protein FJT64_013775 [Amphibalanus amphitrite]|uniref:Uncharacterized protein n=1 Tax=Amphibalanus amphitrite TaxID=1232801 RepID=A0A6A4V9I7_AMPAM|nr:hypothetical protein FJT64_013775 [Amphibalanus amphitrite]